MGEFYYFVPGESGFSQIEKAGIGYAFTRPPQMTSVPSAWGPEGLAGVVFSEARGPLPELQWFNTEEGWWLGHNDAIKPGPADLRRRDVVFTTWANIKMNDGDDWQIPLVAPFNLRDRYRHSGLPTAFQVGEVVMDQARSWPTFMSKNQKVVVAPRFRALHEWALRLQTIDMNGTDQFPMDEVFPFCCALLGAGYRMGQNEALAIDLFGTAQANLMYRVAVDRSELDLWAEERKAEILEAANAE